jgi:hypothetical protein
VGVNNVPLRVGDEVAYRYGDRKYRLGTVVSVRSDKRTVMVHTHSTGGPYEWPVENLYLCDEFEEWVRECQTVDYK